jgi:hypothetical protein
MSLLGYVILGISFFEIMFSFFAKRDFEVFDTEYRINKSLLFLGYVFVLLSIFVFLVPFFNSDEPDFEQMLTAMFILGLGFMTVGNYCILLYKKAKITILEDGFVMASVFSNDTVKWSELRGVEINQFKKTMIFHLRDSSTKSCSLYFTGLKSLLILIEIKTALKTSSILPQIKD